MRKALRRNLYISFGGRMHFHWPQKTNMWRYEHNFIFSKTQRESKLWLWPTPNDCRFERDSAAKRSDSAEKQPLNKRMQKIRKEQMTKQAMVYLPGVRKWVVVLVSACHTATFAGMWVVVKKCPCKIPTKPPLIPPLRPEFGCVRRLFNSSYVAPVNATAAPDVSFTSDSELRKHCIN